MATTTFSALWRPAKRASSHLRLEAGGYLPTAVRTDGGATSSARSGHADPLRWRPVAAIGGIGLVLSLLGCASDPSPLLLAPMIHGVDLCETAPGTATPATEKELAAYCRESGRSAAGLVESTLSRLGPKRSSNDRYEIGYTLPVPLLGLFEPSGSGWEIDRRAVDRLARTVEETDRPVVLHLFSTHFGIRAPVEEYLARDPANLSVSALGPMRKDRYYSIDVYPWTLVSTDTEITRYRQMAIRQFLDAVCRLPPAHRRKIRAITLLGELHHFHADFEHGMGLTGPYVVSDYSDRSVKDFRAFLARRFDEIAALNRAVGEDFATFDEVEPPAGDIRSERLPRFTQHIDSSAHGALALAGWAFDSARPRGEPAWIRVYRGDSPIARIPARYGRQDVAQARPSIGTADVGWRFDMDFTGLAPGVHRLDFFVERPDGTLAKLGSRRIEVMDRGKAADFVAPSAALPAATDPTGLEGSVDNPPDGARLYFNPLVPLWHEFRNEQVVRYLVDFERLVRSSCLGAADLYTHQIAPFVNPSWDTTKFAVDASLTGAGTLKLGISLYGEATYGHSFLDWLASTRHRTYGITEFHPLRPMPPDEVEATFERHRQRGASFVSFFVDARPRSVRDASERNIFAIDPDNPDFGSDRLYASIRAVLTE